LKKRRTSGVRRIRPEGAWQGKIRGLGGRGVLIMFLAVAAALGIVSGLALAAPGGGTATRAIKAHSSHAATKVASAAAEVTTVTGPDTTLTTTIPCAEQAQREEIAPPSVSTVAGEDTTVTETEPGSTQTITEPGSTETLTQDGTTQTVTQPDQTITQIEPGSTVVRTVPGPAVVTTVPGTTETVTDCTSSTVTTTEPGTTATGAVLASASGGTTTKLPGERSDGKHGKRAASDPVATTATGASGGLPFTGLQVPALILIGIGMGAAGLVLRRRAASLD